MKVVRLRAVHPVRNSDPLRRHSTLRRPSTADRVAETLGRCTQVVHSANDLMDSLLPLVRTTRRLVLAVTAMTGAIALLPLVIFH